MRHAPVFELLLKHPYYSDERCPDLAVEPTGDTRRLLKNHRCVLRTAPSGVKVLSSLDRTGQPFLPLSESAEFLFYLRLRNADFALFTDLEEVRGQLAPEYTNIGLGPSTEKELLLVSRRKRHAERVVLRGPSANLQLVLSVQPLAGTKRADFEITETRSAVTVKAYDAEQRILTLDAGSAVAGDELAIEYPAPPRLPRGVFAAVKIRHGGGDGPREYHVAFKQKLARWSYYLVTDLKTEASELKIVDLQPAGTQEPLPFSDSNRTRLGPGADPSDRISTQLAEQYSELNRYRFVSDEPIPCRSAARKYLELHFKGERLAGPLPNPALSSFSTLELPVDGDARQQASLFHVVRYVTPSLPKNGE